MLENKIRMACEFVKIRLLKTLNRTVLMCGWKLETFCLSFSKKRSLLDSIERNILRRIFGVARENGM